MRGNLPWAAAALVVVVIVGVLGWALHPAAPAPEWRIVAVLEGAVPGGALAHSSGIENMYIMKHGSGYDKNSDFSQYVGNDNYCVDVITGSGQSVGVPYDLALDIVVAVKGDAENDIPWPLAYACKENIKADFEWNNGFSYHENSTDLMECVFENQGYYSASGYLRVNAVFDNNGNGWKLQAGAYTSFIINYWCWG